MTRRLNPHLDPLAYRSTVQGHPGSLKASGHQNRFLARILLLALLALFTLLIKTWLEWKTHQKYEAALRTKSP